MKPGTGLLLGHLPAHARELPQAAALGLWASEMKNVLWKRTLGRKKYCLITAKDLEESIGSNGEQSWMLLFAVLSARKGPHQSLLGVLHQTTLAGITKRYYEKFPLSFKSFHLS